MNDLSSRGQGSALIAPPGFSYAEQRKVVLLLTLAYTLNSADRTLIAIIGQPLKLDLRISDTQLGLLVGTAFAVLYSISGLPIARFAERLSRVAIISIAMAVWSCLTALCGTAANFPQLLLIRMGVGVGEAGCTPPAHSLIADYVHPARRGTALSVYSCGISLGYILSALVGGYMAAHFGWRSACLVVGLPGLLVALILARFVREPPRGFSENASSEAVAAKLVYNGLRTEFAEFCLIARQLFTRGVTANIIVGVVIATFVAQGSYAFVPSYFARAFELDYATIGVISALTGGAAVGVGLLSGGFLTDYLGARHPRWYALIPAIGLLISAPLFCLSFLQRNWLASAWLLAIAGFFQYLSFGPTFGIIQNSLDARRRATATAIIYVFLTLIGLGCGPLFTGGLIDHFAQSLFAASNAATLMRDTLGDVSFQKICVAGGTPAVGPIKVACAASQELATRRSLVVTVLLYVWASLHYVLAAVALSRERSRAPGVGPCA
jgi:MFS family permease